MANFIPPPVLLELIPRLLAHIPVAFTSPQLPPSLFPLLSPILRQRLRLLALTTSSCPSPEDTWLSLLTWSSAGGPKLSAHLADQDFTPHPASGELEVGEMDCKGFQRLDEETVKACVELPERGLEVVYVWIADDPDGEDDGWRVMDVHLSSDSEKAEWYPSVSEAEEVFRRKHPKPSFPDNATWPSPVRDFLSPDNGGDGDDDDSYWDLYDRTPARTPVVPQQAEQISEDDYYSRYANTQPTLEPEVLPDVSPPPENSRVLAPLAVQNFASLSPSTTSSTPLTPISFSFPTSKPAAPNPVAITPRPVSAGLPSPPKASVEVLEDAADASTQAELGVKQHISTSIKSLYRLSKTVGMGRDEFERLLHTEIAFLEMMDEGE